MSEPLPCEQARRLLGAYADNELDPAHVLELEQHLRDCADCTSRLDTQRALSAAVRKLPYHNASAALRASLHTRLHAEAPSFAAPLQPVQTVPPLPRPRRQERWARWAMPLAASVVLAFGVDSLLAQRRAADLLGDELVASHVRALQVEHLADVASSDQHTVKPWFAGKLDYAPPVRDLAAQDFPLTGGRLDYLAHRNVAALIYKRRKHIIDLYVWPTGTGNSIASPRSRDGYNLVHWQTDGMEWWAVSDLNAAELEQFAALLRQSAASPAANVPNT